MDFLEDLKSAVPDYAKDIRLNLDASVGRSSLSVADAAGVLLASGFALRSRQITDAVRNSGVLSSADAGAALTAAALMGMNNVWYPYVEMAEDQDLATQRPELRMNAYASHGGIDRSRFEMFALAASIAGKCQFCVRSHYRLLRENGVSVVQLRDIGRIAAVAAAVAQVLHAG